MFYTKEDVGVKSQNVVVKYPQSLLRGAPEGIYKEKDR